MKYNICTLNDELKQMLYEYASFFTFDKSGILLEACEGKDCISFDGERLSICYSYKSRLVYLLQLFNSTGLTGEIKCCFDDFLVMVDMARNSVKTVETVKEFMRYLALMGYKGFQIYLEDVFEITDEPYFGHMRGRYTQAEMKEIAEYGRLIGIKCIPAIQTLAHLAGITRWRKFQLSVIEIDDVLFCGEEATYQLIEKMFATMQECFGGEEINLGMDEAYRVGLGKYLNKHGYTNRSEILVKHLKRVVEIAKKYGFTKPMIWNDMFVRLANGGNYLNAKNVKVSDDVIDLIPENLTLTCWKYLKESQAYYDGMFSIQKQFKRPVYYASGAATWYGVTPMNKYSMSQNKEAIKACKRNGITNYMVTIWGDDGGECALYSILPVLWYTSAIAYNVKDYKKGFKALTGIDIDKFTRLDTPNDATPVAPIFPISEQSKYMLYNDPLIGLYDCAMSEGDGEKYKSIASKLHSLSGNEKWGYLFKTQEMLAKTLYYKYELCAKAKKAYNDGNKAKLEKIAKDDYKKAIYWLDKYYLALRAQWYKENKSFGFEEQDYRIGGLKQRLLNAQAIIKAYLNGEIQKIEEFEQPTLSVCCDETQTGKAVCARTFLEVTSVKMFL